MEKITQFSGSGTAMIGHQSISTSKMALEGSKLRYPNTTAFVLGEHINYPDRLLVSFFLLCDGLRCPSPGEIDTNLACAENSIQSYGVR